ncbi:MAG: hypothetical protein QOG99_2065 [Frankiales bacterium]|nr:hypothetical protein [Frankiales bacterium]
MERTLTWLGLVLCGLIIATTAVLGVMRLVDGPRTLNHVSGPCKPPRSDTTCVTDHYTGSPVGRSWLIVAGTLTICAGAVGVSLKEHRTSLSAA